MFIISTVLYSAAFFYFVIWFKYSFHKLFVENYLIEDNSLKWKSNSNHKKYWNKFIFQLLPFQLYVLILYKLDPPIVLVTCLRMKFVLNIICLQSISIQKKDFNRVCKINKICSRPKMVRPNVTSCLVKIYKGFKKMINRFFVWHAFNSLIFSQHWINGCD